MAEKASRSLGTTIWSVFVAAAVIVGLVVNMIVNRPKLAEWKFLGISGDYLVWLVVVVALCYIVFAVCKHAKAAYERTLGKLKRLRNKLRSFMNAHDGHPLMATVEVSSIHMFERTNRLQSERIRVLSAQLTESDAQTNERFIEIEIDKGVADNFVQGMKFKVIHNARHVELGTWSGNLGTRRTPFRIEFDPNCGVHPDKIDEEFLEVYLILPDDIGPINEFLGELAYIIDVG